jgi:hypothetical protein
VAGYAVAMTPLDRGQFAATYLAEVGEDYADIPDSLERLFDGLHDPDEFYEEAVATLHAARAAVERKATVLAEDPRPSRVTVYPGDLRVNASFTIDSHVLVLGDLDVEGVITANPAHAILMVAGNIRCHGMQLVRAYLFVTGDVVVRDAFLGTVYGFSKVVGRIQTPMYLADSSWANLAIEAVIDEEPTLENVDAELKLDIDAPGAREQLAARLVPGALGADKSDFGEGHGDAYALFDKIARGERIRA